MRYATFVLGLLLVGCTTVYTANYDMSLDQVERPADATERYGSKEVTETDTSYVFEDEFIEAVILPSPSFVGIHITNKTDNSIRIQWDQGAFVGPNGSSQALVHGEMRRYQIGQEVAPTVIPSGASVVKLVSGADEIDNVSLIAGRRVQSATREDSLQFVDDVQALVGESIQLLVPFQIEDTINEYAFHIGVNDVTVESSTQF